MFTYFVQILHGSDLCKAFVFGICFTLFLRLFQYIVHELFASHDMRACGYDCFTCRVWDCRYRDCAVSRMAQGNKNPRP